MYYSKAHYRRVCPPPDTKQDIADRLKRNAAAEQSRLETSVKFPTLSAENVDEALAYQEARYRELIS